MSANEQVKDVLCAYYESLCNGVADGIAKYFDETVTAISLTGSSAINGAEAIDDVFKNLMETWQKLGVSLKIQYDREQFHVEDVQENVKLVRTRLTNFKNSGEIFETWNCLYIFCKTDDGWKISLVTFDDRGTQHFAEAS